MLKVFQEHLKNKYIELCEGIQLLEKLYRVDELYVEGGIQIAKGATKIQTWHELQSHHDILGRVDNTEFKNVILEGDSGFGKTLLCRKMAYDWYKKSPSPYGKLDLLILLNVRYLGGKTSLCRAIKRFLLPYDTKLSTDDLKNILTSDDVSSLIVFDGFHRFPYKDDYEKSELRNIMINKSFQSSHVILTTRSNMLPPDYVNFTKRMKLTGFNISSQANYICDVVCPTDCEGPQNVKSLLGDNPGIFDFCHIPLFFTLLSHLIYSGRITKNVSKEKVTQLFQMIIRGLLETEEEESMHYSSQSDKKINSHEDTREMKLQEMAFDGLRKTRQGFLCEKKKLNKSLGHFMYNKYKQMGILIEEKVMEMSKLRRNVENDDDSIPTFRTEVMFYHTIFCEWFAAHHLSRLAQDINENRLARIVQDISPFNYQYIYRFACGLNDKAAVKIVKYLESQGDTKKFAQLCIVEQEINTDRINEMVKKLCNVPVIIEKDDGPLHQRSLIQLLELASEKKVSSITDVKITSPKII